MSDPRMSSRLPLIFGTSGPVLTEEEARFFEETQPTGFILFARNCETPEQLKKLNADLKSVVPDAHILIDQEGGRVMRMKPPVWPNQTAAKIYGEMYDRSPIMACETVRKDSIEVSKMLRDHGFTVNCVPCCDLYVPGAHAVIGDRAFHADPAVIAILAEAQARACLDAGIQPVIKHLPGHGRANLDSHTHMPVIDVDADLFEDDFAPFQALSANLGESIWGMVAHCVYPTLDDSGLPASASPHLIFETIRGRIGLKGLLLSDDICMNALSVIGGPAERTKACLHAGCDIILHCNGKMDEMREITVSF